MRRYSVVVCLFLSLFAFPASAADIQVTENLVFSIDVTSGWSLHLSDPPDELVKEIASHIAHEPAAANATPEQIRDVARKRLLANEAIVYHAETGAHLDVDFSPLEEGERAPSSKTLKDSAEYASQSLSSEEDVEDVDWSVSSADIEGAEDVFLLSASYLQHHKAMTFRGYIGFVADSWFFLYLTVPGDNTGVLEEMNAMLAGASVQRGRR